MQKFLRKQKRSQKEHRVQTSQLKTLRRMLQNNEKLTPELISRSMDQDKVGSTRQLLLFGKYSEFKKTIHKFITVQEITDDRELAILYSEAVETSGKIVSPQKGEGQQSSQGRSRGLSRQRIVQIVAAVIGILMLLLAIKKRNQLKKIFAKILV